MAVGQQDHGPLQITNGAEREDPLGKKSAWYWDGNTWVLDMVAGSNSGDTSDAMLVRAIGPTANTNLFEVLKNGTIKVAGALISAFTLAKSGSTALTGNVTLTGSGGTTLTQTGQNIDISSSGATGGTPALTLGTANSAGVSSTFIRDDDTILAFDATVPVTQAFGDAAAAGTATVTARRDHKHGMPANPAPSFATPALTLGTANAAGAASTVIRSDATILVFDATVPAAVGTAAAGVATTAPRRDHVHPTGAGTPSTQAFGDAAATGTGPAASMTDHKHGMPTNPLTNPALIWVSGPLSTIPTQQQANTNGSVTPRSYGCEMDTSASASSWAKLLLPLGSDAGGTPTPDFSKIKFFSCLCSPEAASATQLIFVGIQDIISNTAWVSTKQHIGFKLANNGNWFFTAANGTTETTADTGIAGAVQGTLLAFTYDGTTATPYVNGVAKTTIATNLPTAIGSSQLSLTAYIDNQAVANSRLLKVNVISGVVSMV